MTSTTNRETDRQYLQKYLETFRKKCDFKGESLGLPQPLSREDCIVLFDSLSDDQKDRMAKRSGRTAEEFRKLLQEGDLGLSDPKYADVNVEEKAFHIAADLLIEDIEKAAKIIGLEDGIERVFGLFPTGKFNAMCIKPPGDRGYIIAVNYGTFLFLGSIGVLFNRFWDKWSEEEHSNVWDAIDNYTNDYNPKLRRWERLSVWDVFVDDNKVTPIIKNCLDQQTNRLFVAMILSYFFLTFSECTPADVAFPNLMQEEKLDSWSSTGGLGTRLTNVILSFILSHEYAHTTLLVAHTLEEIAKKETENQLNERSGIVGKWMEESFADDLGFDLSCYAEAIRFADGDVNAITKDHFSSALMPAFLGACAFMSCGKMLNDCISSIKKSKVHVSTSHPATYVRQIHLEARLMGFTDRIWEDSDHRIFRAVRAPAVVFDRFINTLWNLNKETITAALLRKEEHLGSVSHRDISVD